jgi:hypothetical protein
LQPARPNEITATVSSNASTFLTFFISTGSPFAFEAANYVSSRLVRSTLRPRMWRSCACFASPGTSRHTHSPGDSLIPAPYVNDRYVSDASVRTANLRQGSPPRRIILNPVSPQTLTATFHESCDYRLLRFARNDRGNPYVSLRRV